MKKSASTRLQNLDVSYVPKSMGLKALRQNSIMCAGMEMFGLHPLCLHYAQNTIGTEMIAFTDWVSTVLKLNTELPARRYWNYKIKDLEKSFMKKRVKYGRPS